MKKSLLLIVLSINLIGCAEEDPTAMVQNQFVTDKKYTYKELLNNRPVCKNIEWVNSNIGGIKKVEYICHIKTSDEKTNGNAIESVSEEIVWLQEETDKKYTIKEVKLAITAGNGEKVTNAICLNYITEVAKANITTPEDYLKYFIESPSLCEIN